jgi:subtilisin family serine protease
MSVLAYDPGIKVEPQLIAQLNADEATGYMVYFREKPDLSPAFGMDWHERGWFVMSALRETAERSQARVRAYLDAQGTQYQAFWIDNVIVVESSSRLTFNSLIDYPEIAALRAQRTMQVIEPVDKTVSASQVPMAIETNISHIKADDVWDLGYKGEGMVVANIDTGVRYTHNALVTQYRGNLGGGSYNHDYNWLDPDTGSNTPSDDHGHGTHTIGTMVGDDGGSNQIGMAPNARWIACDGCNASTGCPDAALLTCAQWVTAPYPEGDPSSANPDLRPHVVNNSWGDCGRSYDNWYQGSVNAWHAAGIYPVFSNGNASNCSYSTPPGCNTVSNPARYGNVTAVGSTGQSNGLYATHSNWGPTDNPDTVNPTGYANLKPLVMAPGVNIRSSLNGSNSAYASWGGTSMSAPHVAGLIALLWQAAPCLVGDYATTETIIQQTATAIPYVTACGGEGPGNVPNHATGWGEIDALAAVQEASNHCGSVDLPWVTQDPISGTIAATGSTNIDVTFLCTEATDHVGTLRVFHNDACESSVDVPILLHCQEELAAGWDKWIDGEPWSPGISVTRETSDTIEIIDVVSSTSPFTLTEMWDSSHLVLIDHELNPPGAGSVTTADGQLQWTRLSGPAEPVTLTKRFHVETCTWTSTILEEELWLDGGVFEERNVTVAKDMPDLWIDAAYEPEVGSGEFVTFTLLYGNTGGYENDVQLRSEFVPEGRFVSSDPWADQLSTAGLWAEWDVGDLAKNDSGSIDVTVEIADGLVPSDTVEIWNVVHNHVGWDVGSFKITYHIADTACEPITGVNFLPWSPISPQTSEIVTFTASLQPPTATLPIVYQWSFDDGGTAPGNPVYHTYTASGTYSVTVTAHNACGGPVSASRDVTVTGQPVNPVYGAELTPPTDAQSGLRGTSLSYGLTVRNTGDTADTFELSFKDVNGWTASIIPSSVNLRPDRTAPVSVTVSIPPGVAAGDSDVATISVTSQGDPTVTAKNALTTTVWELNLFLPLVFKN